MSVYLRDSDLTVHVGDVREVLRELPDGSVDCVVTSPPYWGLRDYGTGSWVGGNEDCDHKAEPKPARKFTNGRGEGVGDEYAGSNLTSWTYRDATPVDGCPKGCGATRQDQQLGLEPTPDAYVGNMVAVFREVRRVLADHGTCWVNLGDSYNAYNGGAGPGSKLSKNQTENRPHLESGYGLRYKGLKPKDLVGIPWRIAFALQADGWILRADIIWAKPNPMPESVTDRPTKAHEYVFLLSKRPRYWFDAEAVREKAQDWTNGGPGTGIAETHHYGAGNGGNAGLSALAQRYKDGAIASGRNVRSVWEIATQPYPEAHFATYPEELVRRCLLAGCPEWVCGVCGRPRERIVEETAEYVAWKARENGWAKRSGDLDLGRGTAGSGTNSATVPPKASTVGWSDCGHNQYRPGRVLDPFLGSGTTAVVARKHGRNTVGIELNPEYAELIARRTRQLSLLAPADEAKP